MLLMTKNIGLQIKKNLFIQKLVFKLKKTTPRYFQNKNEVISKNIQTSVCKILNKSEKSLEKEKGIIKMIKQYKNEIEIMEMKMKKNFQIGVVYLNEKVNFNSKIIEMIIFNGYKMKKNKILNNVINRDKNTINYFKFHDKFNSQNKRNFGTVYEINPNITKRENSENIEINDVLNNINLEVCEFNYKEMNMINENIDFDFLILVSDGMFNLIKEIEKIKQLQNFLFFFVIDNNISKFIQNEKETNNRNFENGSLIKINSHLYNNIEQSEKKKIINSEFFNFFFDILKIENILSWKLSTIKKNISDSKTNFKLFVDSEIFMNNKDWSNINQFFYEEMQNVFFPLLNSYLKTNLKWWKVFFRTNFAYHDLIFFFHENFMVNSIEKFNFFKGYIFSKLEQQNFIEVGNIKSCNFINPILRLKKNILKEKLSFEFKNKISNLVFNSVVYFQTPTFILSFLLFKIFKFDLNILLPVFFLGILTGFSYFLKSWLKFLNVWKNDLFEEMSKCLKNDCNKNGILKNLNQVYTNEILLNKKKNEILFDLEKINIKNEISNKK